MKTLKSLSTNKKFIMFLIVSFMFVAASFAEGSGITELDTWATNILTLFQSPWVKAILLVMLICEAIGVVLAGQQGGGGAMLKKFAPWIVGTIVLLSASSICSYFLGNLSFSVK